MRRGIFSFFIIMLFIASSTQIIALNSKQNKKTLEAKQLFIEQQVLLNKEREFKNTFWNTVVYSARKTEGMPYPLRKLVLATDLLEWQEKMRERNIQVSLNSELVEIAPNQKNNFVFIQGKPFENINATIEIGESVFLSKIMQGEEHDY